METPATPSRTVEYRVVLFQPARSGIRTVAESGRFRLPRTSISEFNRPLQQLQDVIRAVWGVHSIILDMAIADDVTTCCVVAESLEPVSASIPQRVMVDQIVISELSGAERDECELLLTSRTPFSRVGWIDEALAWIESVTGRTFSAKGDIVQLNSGGGFMLLRVTSDDGIRYWLKATGEPNTHEFLVTSLLSHLYPDFLPKFVASISEWNSWLMEDAGQPLSEALIPSALLRCASRFGTLQIQTIAHAYALLDAGAFDQRLPILRNHVDAVIAYLIEAMARQTSTNVAPLSRNRLVELGEILSDTCFRLEALHIPDALIHNDLNLGNILYDGKTCVFIDWSEAAVGNPFISLERFCLLSPHNREALRCVYGECWSEYLYSSSIKEAYTLAPLLAIFAYLYGRGDWLKDGSRVQPQFESYARSLARHMDHAADDPLLLETLCH